MNTLRSTILAMLAALLLSIAAAHAGPVAGHVRVRNEEGGKPVLRPGEPLQLRNVFRGNERACVIVEGDYDPSMKLTIEVRDAADKVVVSRSGTDLVAVIWYPPRTEQYKIVISSDGKVFNELEIVMK